MLKYLFWWLEDLVWNIRCRYSLWLHGPYGLSRVIEQLPFKFLIKYLRKYGAKIGHNCLIERGLNLHRPFGEKPFENLWIGDNVYLGHDTLIDLSCEVILKDRVIIASRCQIWTHASYYNGKVIENNGYVEKLGRVLIDECALVYSGVIITHGITIGKFARIGACSLVNKNVESFSLVGGVPCTVIKH